MYADLLLVVGSSVPWCCAAVHVSIGLLVIVLFGFRVPIPSSSPLPCLLHLRKQLEKPCSSFLCFLGFVCARSVMLYPLRLPRTTISSIVLLPTRTVFCSSLHPRSNLTAIMPAFLHAILLQRAEDEDLQSNCVQRRFVDQYPKFIIPYFL